MVDSLKDDLALQLMAFKLGLIREVDHEPISELAACLEYPLDWSRESDLPTQAGELLDRYSLRATQFVLEKTREFARENGKKLLVVLFDPYRAMAESGWTRSRSPTRSLTRHRSTWSRDIRASHATRPRPGGSGCDPRRDH